MNEKARTIVFNISALLLLAGAGLYLALPLPVEAVTGLYALTVGTGYVCLLMGGLWMMGSSFQ